MKSLKYFTLLIFIIGCISQNTKPPKRLQIENFSKTVIRDFKLKGNEEILNQHSEEIYDSSGNLRETVVYFNRKMDFSDISHQKIFLYDSLNNNIEIISCSFDESFGSYFYDTTKYEYDKNKNLKLEITGRAGIHTRKHFYEYDSSNQLVKDYIYRWGYGQYLIAYKTLYKYDTTHKLIEKNNYSVFLNPKPELLKTENFEYDKNGNLIKYNLKESSASTPGNFVYNLSKQIRRDLKGNTIKEWYDLQTFDLAFSEYQPDTVIYEYNSENKKISELRLFTSDLTNKHFNSDPQKNVFLNQFQTDNKFNKIEQERYFYDENLRLVRIEYFTGNEIDKLSLDKVKRFTYEKITAYNKS